MTVAAPKRPATVEAREMLRQAVPRAAEVLVKLLEATDEKLRLRASEAILTLAGIVHVPSYRYLALDPMQDKWNSERPH